MSNDQMSRVNKSNKRWGCFSVIFLALLINVVFLATAYVLINRQLNMANEQIEEKPLEEIVVSGDESIELVLNRDVVNRLFNEMLSANSANGLDLSLSWEDDAIVARTQINQNGFQAPATILGDVTISPENYLVIDIQSVKLAEIPIPTETAYQLFVSQLSLPNGATFSASQPQILINLNQLDGIDPSYSLIPKSVDLENNELVIEVNYDATTNPLLRFN
ncbi:DUF2140 family protein [Fundicoccus sp. Sow4_H7]|uniref:DUF2140 family protein n=1 Tax=Fundicoccus sp. Sow4_H7 TaxID=3438784 RepID=UPI003F909077